MFTKLNSIRIANRKLLSRPFLRTFGSSHHGSEDSSVPYYKRIPPGTAVLHHDDHHHHHHEGMSGDDKLGIAGVLLQLGLLAGITYYVNSIDHDSVKPQVSFKRQITINKVLGKNHPSYQKVTDDEIDNVVEDKKTIDIVKIEEPVIVNSIVEEAPIEEKKEDTLVAASAVEAELTQGLLQLQALELEKTLKDAVNNITDNINNNQQLLQEEIDQLSVEDVPSPVEEVESSRSSAYVSPSTDSEVAVFTGNSNTQLATEVCSALGVQLGRANVGAYADGVSIENNNNNIDTTIILDDNNKVNIDENPIVNEVESKVEIPVINNIESNNNDIQVIDKLVDDVNNNQTQIITELDNNVIENVVNTTEQQPIINEVIITENANDNNNVIEEENITVDEPVIMEVDNTPKRLVTLECPKDKVLAANAGQWKKVALSSNGKMLTL